MNIALLCVFFSFILSHLLNHISKLFRLFSSLLAAMSNLLHWVKIAVSSTKSAFAEHFLERFYACIRSGVLFLELNPAVRQPLFVQD